MDGAGRRDGRDVRPRVRLELRDEAVARVGLAGLRERDEGVERAPSAMPTIARARPSAVAGVVVDAARRAPDPYFALLLKGTSFSTQPAPPGMRT